MDTLVNLATNIINWFSWFFALAAVAMGLYSGLLYFFSGGDAEKTRSAQKIFIFAIIAVVVAIFSLSIVYIARSFIS